MPIYEYECPSCGHQFERMVKMGAEAPECPECAGREVRKLVSASGFILQGGGWYKDHYGLKKDAKAPAKAEAKKSETPAAPTPPAKSS